MSELRDAVVAVKVSSAAVDVAIGRFLSVTRRSQSFVALHGALEDVGEALQGAAKAQRELALVLALDPTLLAGDEPLVEPIIEHVGDPTES